MLAMTKVLDHLRERARGGLAGSISPMISRYSASQAVSSGEMVQDLIAAHLELLRNGQRAASILKSQDPSVGIPFRPSLDANRPGQRDTELAWETNNPIDAAAYEACSAQSRS